MSTPLLLLEDIHASYVKKEILSGVYLTMESGEVVALLGGNGSGKSTLLKVISGVLAPTQGRIWFAGKDITTTSIGERQGMGIGYLLQGGCIFASLSVEENFRIAFAHARQRTHHQNGIRANIGSIFPDLVSQRAVRAGLLSGGQRQMLAIEMILAQQPILSLLDEPTGPLSQPLASNIIDRLSEKCGRVPHSLLLVEQNYDKSLHVDHRQLFLQNGTIRQPELETRRVN